VISDAYFGLKVNFVVRNYNFNSEFEILSEIKVLVKNKKFWPQIKILVKNLNLAEKSKL